MCSSDLVRVDDAVPDHVVGDAQRLRQVLMNLLGNAIKFTSVGKVGVFVELVSQRGEDLVVKVSVSDTGIGVPADKQQVIFEAFRQADGSTTRKYGGTGLGLSICSRLVEMMGGKIGVDSEPGRGSTFHFTVRLEAVTGTANAEPDQPTDTVSLRNMVTAVGTDVAAPSLNLDVLLAEDNAVNQRLVKRLLEKRGHSVTVAGTGREAVEHALAKRFHIILMDVQMPDMDGLETTAHIRQWEKPRGLYTPIIALTAHAMKGDRERCLDAGMDKVINKPIDAAHFVDDVEAAVLAAR